MRLFLPLLLLPASALPGQSTEPGVPAGFHERVAGYLATDPLDLWRKEIRRPAFTAVVEVVGELSREEKQELAFLEMRTRLLAELRELLKDTAPMAGRSGGPALFTLVRANF